MSERPPCSSQLLAKGKSAVRQHLKRKENFVLFPGPDLPKMISGHTQFTTLDNKVIILGGNEYNDPETKFEESTSGKRDNLDIYR